MILDFNFQIKQLNGSPFEGEDGNAGKILGNFIASSGRGNPIKLWDWANIVYHGQPLEIDSSDSNMLSEMISGSETLPVITKAQLLEVISTKNKI